MPNWCSSSYSIVGKKKEVKALYKLMNKLQKMKEPLVENGFGSNWLGCLVTALGGNYIKIYCRGSWEGLELINNTQINFFTETAWSPCNEVWDFIQKKFPSLSYFYISEEPGMAVYITNDEYGDYFPDKYKVDLCSPDDQYVTEYFSSEESMFQWFKDSFDIEVNSMNDIQSLSEKWEQENEDAYCYVYEFENVYD